MPNRGQAKGQHFRFKVTPDRWWYFRYTAQFQKAVVSSEMAEYLEESDSERSDCAELQKRSYLLDLLESCDLLDLLESYDLLELLERYDLLQQFREENGDEENGAKDNGAEENSAEENGAEENSAEENSAEENGVETNGTELLQVLKALLCLALAFWQ